MAKWSSSVPQNKLKVVLYEMLAMSRHCTTIERVWEFRMYTKLKSYAMHIAHHYTLAYYIDNANILYNILQ